MGGKLSLPFELTRRGEFQGAFGVKAMGTPEIVKSKEMPIPEKATNGVLVLDLAETKLPAGRHRVWLEGKLTGKYRDRPEAAESAAQASKAAEKAAADAATEQKRLIEVAGKAQDAEKESAAAAVAAAEVRLKRLEEEKAASAK